jgi:hypothetical protein
MMKKRLGVEPGFSSPVSRRAGNVIYQERLLNQCVATKSIIPKLLVQILKPKKIYFKKFLNAITSAFDFLFGASYALTAEVHVVRSLIGVVDFWIVGCV